MPEPKKRAMALDVDDAHVDDEVREDRVDDEVREDRVDDEDGIDDLQLRLDEVHVRILRFHPIRDESKFQSSRTDRETT
jgi:hypothetical protein